MATWRIHDRKPGPETWSCHVSRVHVLRLGLPHSFGDRSVRIRFVLRRPPTFAITRCAVPDIESHFSRQAEFAHGRSQQHVAARSLPFFSESFPLLFDERAHIAIRGTACRSRRSGGRLRARGRLGPAPLAIVGAHGQVRPERTRIEVVGPVAETHVSSMVTKAKTSGPNDRARWLPAPLAAEERDAPSLPGLQQFLRRCCKGHGRLVRTRCPPHSCHAPKPGHRPDAIGPQHLGVAARHDPGDCLGDRPPRC